jgi:hypothetical protein
VGKQLDQNLTHFEKLALDRSLRRKEEASVLSQTASPPPSSQADSDGNPFGDADATNEAEGEAREERELKEVVEFVREVDGSFLNLFLRFSDAYQDLFVHRPDTAPADRASALRLLDDFAIALFRRYLALVRAHFLVSCPTPTRTLHVRCSPSDSCVLLCGCPAYMCLNRVCSKARTR